MRKAQVSSRGQRRSGDVAMTTCQESQGEVGKGGRKWQEGVRKGGCKRKVLSSPDDILTVARHVPWAVSNPLGTGDGFPDHSSGPSQVPGAI